MFQQYHCCQQITNPANKWIDCNSCSKNKFICSHIPNQQCCNNSNGLCTWSNGMCINQKGAPLYAKEITPCTSTFSPIKLCYVDDRIDHDVDDIYKIHNMKDIQHWHDMDHDISYPSAPVMMREVQPSVPSVPPVPAMPVIMSSVIAPNPQSAILNNMQPSVSAIPAAGPQIMVPQTMVPQIMVPQTMVPQIMVPQTMVPHIMVPQTTVPQTTVPQTLAPNISDQIMGSIKSTWAQIKNSLGSWSFLIIVIIVVLIIYLLCNMSRNKGTLTKIEV